MQQLRAELLGREVGVVREQRGIIHVLVFGIRVKLYVCILTLIGNTAPLTTYSRTAPHVTLTEVE